MSNKSRNEAARGLLSQNAEFASVFNFIYFKERKIKPEELMISAIDYSCLRNDPQIRELSEAVSYSVTRSYGRCDLMILPFFDSKASDYFAQQGKVMLESLCMRQQLFEFRRVEQMRPVIIIGLDFTIDKKEGGAA